MRKSHVIWGLLLIIIGVLWILGSTDVLQFRMDILGSLSTLWPVFIVAAGITLLLKKEARALKAVVWVIAIAIVAGYGIYLGSGGSSIAGGDVHVFEMREGMEHARLEVNTGAATLRIGASDSAMARVGSNIPGLRANFTGGRNSGIVFSQQWKPFRIDSGKDFAADLNRNLTWDLEFNTGAVEGIIDFSGFPMENCVVNAGACDLRIVAGTLQEKTTIECNGGTVSISITIPEGTGIRIKSDAVANDIGGKGITLRKDDRVYESTNYDTADRTIDLNISSAVTKVNVTVP